MWTDPPMAILRRGDRVLVVMGKETDAQDVSECNAVLSESFPGVEFVVLNGADAIYLYTDDAS